MNQTRRAAAGAAIASMLVTPPVALAGSPTAPGTAKGSTPTGTVPLPDGAAQCLMQTGVTLPAPGTDLQLPKAAGAPPANLADLIPLSGINLPAGTTTSAIPITLPPTSGVNPIPVGGGATSSNGVQCGQIIINNTVYMIVLTVTVTTTTTTANGPMTAANGPVNIAGNTPAAAPVVTPPVPARKQPTRRTKRRHRSTHRKHHARQAARTALTLQVRLVKKNRAGAHGGRGSSTPTTAQAGRRRHGDRGQ